MKTRIWLLASRPKTLLASISPVLIGTAPALKEAQFSLWVFVCTLLYALLIQVGTNLSNDYFDALKGADTKARKGPVRVTSTGLIPPEKVKQAFILIFLTALVIAVPLAIRGGIWIWCTMVLSVILGYLYTGGKYPLAYLGLGDVFVFIFFGPVACVGTYYLQTLSFSYLSFSLGVGVGLISTAILVVNNLRDIDEDRVADKKTLAVRFGKTFSQIEYMFCITAAFSIVLSHIPYIFWILMLPILPFTFRLFRGVFTKTAFELNAVLAQTAALLLFYTILSVVSS